MRARRIGVAAAVALLGAACGGTVVPGLSSGSTGVGGVTGTGGVTVNGGTGGAKGTGGSGGHGTSSATGGGGPDGGPTCSACLGVGCSGSAYCGYGDHMCGGNDAPGVCVPRPQGCSKIFQPTCGCDGKVYGNTCEAEMAGVDISAFGGCTPPAGTFGCGAFFCALGTQYCAIMGGTDVPFTYTCEPLPSCADPTSCSCVMSVPCPCTTPAEGGIVVTCVSE